MSSLIEESPLALPPPGIKANFQNPESRASWIYIAAAVCLPLIILFASLRFYAKLYLTKARTWDDGRCPSRVVYEQMLMTMQLHAQLDLYKIKIAPAVSLAKTLTVPLDRRVYIYQFDSGRYNPNSVCPF